MRHFFFPLASLSLAIVVANKVQAQPSKQPLLALAVSATPATATVLVGRVETTTGILPGAVVEVRSNKNLRAVTDADGFFRLVIPATTGPVSVTASYAGYDEVSASLVPGAQPAVLRLVVPHDDVKLLR